MVNNLATITAAIVWYTLIFRSAAGRRPHAWPPGPRKPLRGPAGHAFCWPRKNSTQATIFNCDPNFFSQSIGPIVSYKFVKTEFLCQTLY